MLAILSVASGTDVHEYLLEAGDVALDELQAEVENRIRDAGPTFVSAEGAAERRSRTCRSRGTDLAHARARAHATMRA